jgi:small GTP-binding protein
MTFKVVLVGPSHCGKTSLIHRFVNDTFTFQTQASTQAALFRREVQSFGHKCTLDIWDTAGQERFRALTPMFYRDARGAFVVFDLTDEHSLQATQQWASELRQNRGPLCPIVVVGNKLDLSSQRSSKVGAAKGWADQNSYEYFETSAKTGANVEKAFMALVKKMEAVNVPVTAPGSPRRRGTSVRFETPPPQAESSCC